MCQQNTEIQKRKRITQDYAKHKKSMRIYICIVVSIFSVAVVKLMPNC